MGFRKNIRSVISTFLDIPQLEQDSEVTVADYNELVDSINSALKKISLSANIDGQIVEITIPAGETLVIPHRLGIKPAYRIILRQSSDSVISDIDSGWNSQQIELKNNGITDNTLKILISRE